MASLHGNVTLAVCKNGNNVSQSKFPSTTFLPGFDVVGRVSSAWKKELIPSSVALIPRATLTFDPQTTNSDKTKQKKHTFDPASPDFQPLPSFEQCFPKSTKEYRCALSSSFLFYTTDRIGFQIRWFSYHLLANWICTQHILK